MTSIKVIGCASAVAILTACGGTGGGDSFADLADAFEARAERLTNDDAEATVFADLPTSGSASFSGEAALITSEDKLAAFEAEDSDPEDIVAEDVVDYLGKLEIDLTWGDDSELSGSATDFRNTDNESVSGSMTIADGAVGDFFGSAIWGGELSGSVDGNSTDGGVFGAVVDGGNGLAGIGGPDDDADDDFVAIFLAED